MWQANQLTTTSLEKEHPKSLLSLSASKCLSSKPNISNSWPLYISNIGIVTFIYTRSWKAKKSKTFLKQVLNAKLRGSSALPSLVPSNRVCLTAAAVTARVHAHASLPSQEEEGMWEQGGSPNHLCIMHHPRNNSHKHTMDTAEKSSPKPLGVCKMTKNGSDKSQSDHMPAQMRENVREKGLYLNKMWARRSVWQYPWLPLQGRAGWKPQYHLAHAVTNMSHLALHAKPLQLLVSNKLAGIPGIRDCARMSDLGCWVWYLAVYHRARSMLSSVTVRHPSWSGWCWCLKGSQVHMKTSRSCRC